MGLAFLKPPVAALVVLAGFGDCEAVQPPVVNFHYSMQPPAFSREYGSAQLQQMRGGAGGDGHVGGLTRNEIVRDVSVATMEQERLLGGTCVWPSQIDITVELRPTVWVASEYTDGSCRYNIAYGHELTHVKIARDTLAEFMPGIERVVRAMALAQGVRGPFQDGGGAAAQKAVMEEITGALSNAMERVNMVLEQRQAVIDTPESYLQQSRACGSEPLWGGR